MTRVYIAGIGTTGVLVAATIMLLAVVGALVAFNGGSQQELPGPIRDIVLRESPAAPAPARRAAPAAERARARSGAAAPAGARADRAAGGVRALRAESAPVRRAPTASSPQRRRISRPRPVSPAPPPVRGGNRPATGLERLGGSLGDTTQRLTNGLDNALAPVSPSLGSAVQGLGDNLSQSLRQLGAPR